jgi:hypothetical protein
MNKLSQDKVEELKEKIQYCRDRDEYLNDRERGFLESIQDGIYKYNNLTWPQQKNLLKIHTKIIMKQG